MTSNTKTVFISYRRAPSSMTARALFQALRERDCDVFMDVESIDSGFFEKIILRQIEARMHFILVLEPETLTRCDNPNDWLRREVELAIALNRNIIPILADGFEFDEIIRERLPKSLKSLSTYNAINLYHEYFDAAIEKLMSRFLRPQKEIRINPLTESEKEEVTQLMSAESAVANSLSGPDATHGNQTREPLIRLNKQNVSAKEKASEPLIVLNRQSVPPLETTSESLIVLNRQDAPGRGNTSASEIIAKRASTAAIKGDIDNPSIVARIRRWISNWLKN